MTQVLRSTPGAHLASPGDVLFCLTAWTLIMGLLFACVQSPRLGFACPRPALKTAATFAFPSTLAWAGERPAPAQGPPAHSCSLSHGAARRET